PFSRADTAGVVGRGAATRLVIRIEADVLLVIQPGTKADRELVCGGRDRRQLSIELRTCSHFVRKRRADFVDACPFGLPSISRGSIEEDTVSHDGTA